MSISNLLKSIFGLQARRKKVGLVLGGGVARGIAHIGVLKVLAEHKIPIDYVVGVSSGSIVAGAFATGMPIDLIEQIALNIHWTNLIKPVFWKPGFMSSEAIEEFFIKYFGDPKFSQLKVPFAVVASDLKDGKRVVLSSGKVARAVRASASFPGVFTPTGIEHQQLIDGGATDNLPADVAFDMGAEYVIASDVIPGLELKHVPQEAFLVMGRSLDIILKTNTRLNPVKPSIVIEPEIEDDIWHLDIGKAKRLIKAGEIAANGVANRIKRSI